MSLSAETATEPTTRAIILESLFVFGIPVQGEFLRELRALGIDPARLQPTYPRRLFHKSLDLACRHAFSGLPTDAAMREVGRAFIRGFSQTLAGKVVCAGLPLLGPVRYLKRYPEHLKMDNTPITVRPVQLGERAFRLEYQVDPGSHPYFFAGLIEQALRLTAVTPQIDVELKASLEFDLNITWS